MGKLEDFRKLVHDFSEAVDFVVVYIAEAHTMDGWHLKNNNNARPHQNMEERVAAAGSLVSLSLPCPLLVDTMQNTAAMSFRAMPDRIVVVKDGRLCHAGKRGPVGYSINDVRDCLNKLVS